MPFSYTNLKKISLPWEGGHPPPSLASLPRILPPPPPPKIKSWLRHWQRECRTAYHTYIQAAYISDMLCEEDSNPKRFWSYIKSTRCENPGVAPLLQDGILQCDASAKANLLNDQFTSVFMRENASHLPDLGASPHPRGGGGGGGVLRFGSDGGVPLKPPNLYPSLSVILVEKGTHY